MGSKEGINILKSCGLALNSLKEKNPLVHHITNYVSANDCANISLCIGASPVMADSIYEVADMVRLSKALVINMGTINERAMEAMLLAGKEANEQNIPIVLDPVGFLATPYRKKCTLELLKKMKFSIIKGNMSEILGIICPDTLIKGVDSAVFYEELTLNTLEMLKNYSKENSTVLAITGKVDYIICENYYIKIYNGHPYLKNITGTGCMIASLIGSYLGAYADTEIATIGGILTMSISGELAFRGLNNGNGIGTFKVKLFDAVSSLSKDDFIKEGKIDVFYFK